MRWTVTWQEFVEIRPDKYLVKEHAGDGLAGGEKLTSRLPGQIPSGAARVQKVGALALNDPHLPCVLGGERRDPYLVRLLEVRMFAPKPPERMGPASEDGHLSLVGQRRQTTVPAWKNKHGSPGTLALQGDDPIGERRGNADGWISLLLAGKLGDELGHLNRGWRLEQRAHGEIDAESFTEPRHCRRDDQGITAQLEEVVVWPDRVEVQDVSKCRLDKSDR